MSHRNICNREFRGFVRAYVLNFVHRSKFLFNCKGSLIGVGRKVQ